MLPALLWGDAYYSIALSLNLLLTLMIITRLVLHSKNIRSALGAQHGVGGLYKTIIAMLVESCALYAVSFVLLVAPWASQNVIQLITFQILPELQVRSVFLLPRPSSILGCLTVMTNSALPRSSLPFGSLTEPR
jgi:hypothetical protein